MLSILETIIACGGQREQKKRLVALGMDESVVARMTAREVLTKLKHPMKVAKEFGGE